MKKNNAELKSILVRTPQWLGDAVAATVFVRRLKARFLESRITVLCAEGVRPLFDQHPDVADVMPIRPNDTLFSVVMRIKARRFDAAYILPRSFRTALETTWGGVPHRIGYPGDFRGFLLTEVIPYDKTVVHSTRYLGLLKEKTLDPTKTTPYFPCVRPLHGDLAALADQLEKMEKPFLGIAPVSLASARNWEFNRFAETASLFQKECGGTVILFGSKKDKPINDRLRPLIKGPVVDTTGLLNFPALGWFVSQCSYFLCNDSGLMHVASAFQVPMVVVFGAGNPVFAVPPWGRITALHHPEIPCTPCDWNQCPRFGSYNRECLKATTTADVLKALLALSS